MVKRVERFGAELNADGFGDKKVLEQAQVDVLQPGPWNARGAQLPNFPLAGIAKAAGLRKKPGAPFPTNLLRSSVAPWKGSPTQFARDW